MAAVQVPPHSLVGVVMQPAELAALGAGPPLTLLVFEMHRDLLPLRVEVDPPHRPGGGDAEEMLVELRGLHIRHIAPFRAWSQDQILAHSEPGRTDFLRYIEEKLAPRCQVIYTTHSPFMVPSEHLHRVRLVEDKGKRQGSSVSQDVMSTDRDTLFPLQGALGYDLTQNLFVGPHNLIVEGTSDFTYLQALSSHLASKGRTHLDPRWTIVPVGGADQLATFAALLGTHLRATILLDSHPKGNQRLDSVVREGILRRSKVIGVGEILERVEADIEDLFDPEEYLRMFNLAFTQSIMIGELTGSDPIVKRLARRIDRPRFDHGRPATILLRQQAVLLDGLSETTLARFERLFARINQTLD